VWNREFGTWKTYYARAIKTALTGNAKFTGLDAALTILGTDFVI